MNKELLEYAKELKKRSESLIKAELENEEFTFRLNDWDKLIHPNKLIQLCNEVERINNMEPVAWMFPSIGKSDCMVITKSAEESENIEIFFDSHGLPFKVIPLYRLDK
ncbi:TPA: hypothetical protein U2M35_004125 [Providencia rettgeri]|nr:hypothetical protein [Providencia rettgeri]HEM8182663.1 hypothetical protein [Providencia rettgeri]